MRAGWFRTTTAGDIAVGARDWVHVRVMVVSVVVVDEKVIVMTRRWSTG